MKKQTYDILGQIIERPFKTSFIETTPRRGRGFFRGLYIWIPVMLLFYALTFWCVNAFALVDSDATTETQALYTTLESAQGNYIYFGQEGFIYRTSGGFCDAYRITGKFPYIYGVDYVNEIELTFFAKSSIQNHYNQGGIVTVCWHMKNKVTGGDYADKTGDPVVNILPGGSHRSEYLTALDGFATWVATLTDSGGNLIPIIFRPFHENDGNWFWWGTDTCTEAQYIELWQDMVEYLRDTKGVHNLLWCYSPEIISGYTYDGTLYPGDDYVDIFGIDRYTDDSINTIMTYYEQASDAAIAHNKVFAITEGLRNLSSAPKSDFWTAGLIDPILANAKASRAAYVCVWSTYPDVPETQRWGAKYGSIDADNFLEMSQNSRIRLIEYGGLKFQGSLTIEGSLTVN